MCNQGNLDKYILMKTRLQRVNAIGEGGREGGREGGDGGIGGREGGMGGRDGRDGSEGGREGGREGGGREGGIGMDCDKMTWRSYLL